MGFNGFFHFHNLQNSLAKPDTIVSKIMQSLTKLSVTPGTMLPTLTFEQAKAFHRWKCMANNVPVVVREQMVSRGNFMLKAIHMFKCLQDTLINKKNVGGTLKFCSNCSKWPPNTRWPPINDIYLSILVIFLIRHQI
jgi:hypothetical protein